MNGPRSFLLIAIMTFEVPEAAAEELLLVYSPNFLDSTYEIELF